MGSKIVLFINLGSPDSPAVKDVKKYLAEFLMDGRVIDMPYWSRALLVKGIIVPARAPKSAAKYSTIWTKDGSPLVHLTKRLASSVKDESDFHTYVCMRYGNPTPRSAMDKIRQEHPGAGEIIVFPLYPHYAMSSYETAVEYIKEEHSKNKYPFKLRFIPPFFDDTFYINALSESIRPYLQKAYDHVLFSYHGIPERHIKKTDPTSSHCLASGSCCEEISQAHQFCYRHQIKKTTLKVVEKLQIPSGKYSFSFQSRLGRDKWLLPFTVDRLMKMPAEGIRKLVILCPAFVSDCLETLEEICVEGKEIFMENGGEEFTVVPCLNERPDWIKAVIQIINNN